MVNHLTRPVFLIAQSKAFLIHLFRHLYEEIGRVRKNSLREQNPSSAIGKHTATCGMR